MTIEEAYNMLQKIECRACSVKDGENYETPTTVLAGLDQNDVWSCATFLLDYLDENIIKHVSRVDEPQRMTYQRFVEMKGE